MFILLLIKGGYAVWFDQGSFNNTIESSVVQDVGAGGVRIGTNQQGYQPDISQRAEGNVVSNCYIMVRKYVLFLVCL
jgi:hypothetical protein